MSRKSTKSHKKMRAPSPRQRLLHAFQAIAQTRRFEQITLLDVAREAGLGRATLYRHFGSKDGLMVAALDPLLAALADAGTQRSNAQLLTPWLTHAWERRWLLRSLLASPSRPAIERRLAELIAERLALNHPSKGLALDMLAVGISSAQLSMLHAWVAGLQSLPLGDMTDCMLATSDVGDQQGAAPTVNPGHQELASRLYAALATKG